MLWMGSACCAQTKSADGPVETTAESVLDEGTIFDEGNIFEGRSPLDYPSINVPWTKLQVVKTCSDDQFNVSKHHLDEMYQMAVVLGRLEKAADQIISGKSNDCTLKSNQRLSEARATCGDPAEFANLFPLPGGKLCSHHDLHLMGSAIVRLEDAASRLLEHRQFSHNPAAHNRGS